LRDSRYVAHTGEVVGDDPPPKKPSLSVAATEYQSQWLTASEAALHLRVQTRTVLLWVRQGKLKGYALSGAQRHVWRFRAVDLDRMMMEPSVAFGNRRIP
jgi:excisionase family DNA binding protein